MILIVLVVVMCVLFFWLSVDYSKVKKREQALNGDYDLFCILSTDQEKLRCAYAQLHNELANTIVYEEEDCIYSARDAVFLFSDGAKLALKVDKIIQSIEGLAKLYLIVDKDNGFLWQKAMEDLNMKDALVKSTIVDLNGGLL